MCIWLSFGKITKIFLSQSGKTNFETLPQGRAYYLGPTKNLKALEKGGPWKILLMRSIAKVVLAEAT